MAVDLVLGPEDQTTSRGAQTKAPLHLIACYRAPLLCLTLLCWDARPVPNNMNVAILDRALWYVVSSQVVSWRQRHGVERPGTTGMGPCGLGLT